MKVSELNNMNSSQIQEHEESSNSVMSKTNLKNVINKTIFKNIPRTLKNLGCN